MSVFAYISILEVVLKLLIVYELVISSFDKLITYAVLIVSVSLIIRFIYGWYCGRNFDECRGKLTYDHSIFKEMLGFAGWNFLSNGVYIFNNQGITMLVNMYFGVAMNAARGIATQVESSVQQFTNNFTTAINPQITKSYAIGEKERLYYLIYKGAKFSFFLLFGISLPILMETDFILKIWLKTVPEYTALFTRLAFVSTMIGVLGNSCYTACLATGNIKRYTLYTSLISSLVFFTTWIIYKMGGNVESSYYIYAVDWAILLVVKLFLAKKMVGLNPVKFFQEVVLKIIPPLIISMVIPLVIIFIIPQSVGRFFLTSFFCIITTLLSIYFWGLTPGERISIKNNISSLLKKKFKRKMY